MKKLFLIIGAPGSGKTTDASIIAQNNDTIVHYSTGDMLREEVASGSTLGQEIESYISKGALVPLDIIVNTIVTAINNAPVNTVLIDGYPRSTEQMTAFDALVAKEENIELASVIEVRVSEQVARERILGRRAEAAPGQERSDDSEEVFNDRMKIYTDPLTEIQAFYTQKNLLKVISGERTLEEVVADMEAFIKNNM
ncbi:MAG TPA: adenylate kinase [Sulfurovum sp.]|jgi:adenylate kinase|nr:MAG: adenylate kinase [Sulfurovum sp. 35-42-20]OYY55381.1 MAG: adenylate kinase [Sulfurovum sp. 28-43-6]OYZ25397.1 MAG: adenylate kinase [Sulfurovum sp. 16-42-52]OYZ49865.1 MAG: adenylate kinase [Sulfurovum sp. 24-42-9]OZA45493.1 MAG: adenylate kinase [Sulfurovum sp. 17-42-90]OZA59424.1 MAG: adenylate kinase [Sulfurovum sp. 39-42-12]HQR74072.1 adenylate kinase [Sulfurovum sp.]